MSAETVGILVVVVVVGLIVFAIVVTILNKIKKNQKMDELKASGFKVDHLMKAGAINVGFDVESREAAFVSSKEIKRIPFSDITKWEHSYTERNRTSNGVHSHSFVNNAMHFTINDANNPLIKVSIASYSYGETWLARLSAILNG